MKDIKTMMIGFLLATCMFLMMGADGDTIRTGTFMSQYDYNMLDKRLEEIAQTGRYQGFGDTSRAYLVDTETGQLWERNYYSKGTYWVKDIKAGDFRK